MSESQILTTTLNRKWVTKMGIFLLALVILGVWGTMDAVWLYPRSGRHHVQFMLKDYLDRLADSGAIMRDASVADPAAALKDLGQKRDLDPTSIEGARKQWLESLSRIASLRSITKANSVGQPAAPSATNIMVTTFADPVATRELLKQELANANSPKPLAAYDIPLQWLFAAIGFGGSIWMVYFLLRCKGTRFRFDPESNRLTLPDGKSFIPADITDVDKRDWHKFFIYMNINGFDGEQKFDLLRYSPLEDWIEEMRKLRPGYDPAEDAKPEEESATENGQEAAESADQRSEEGAPKA
jgi:hypothetical protein